MKRNKNIKILDEVGRVTTWIYPILKKRGVNLNPQLFVLLEYLV
ncbi:hypothetical protein Mpsy_0003 [Methanolobus psychrophilus R15]|nr:hypothetical protein Mpsy_0003 [Methanolobus psychrophilus R15]